MKTNFFVKTAVVAMAAFGAFAFNGNTQENALKEFSIQQDLGCTDILAECSMDPNGPVCRIEINENPTDVYQLQCAGLVQHDNSTPVYWEFPN